MHRRYVSHQYSGRQLPLYAITTGKYARSKTKAKTKTKLTLRGKFKIRTDYTTECTQQHVAYKGRRCFTVSARTTSLYTKLIVHRRLNANMYSTRAVTEHAVRRRFDADQRRANWTANVGKPLVVTSLVVVETRSASFKLRQLFGNWTTRGLDISRTGQLAVSQIPPKRETKQAKSPMASASCPVRDLSSTRVV